ncbi:DUF6243 family protein [Streptomyces sp. NPDC029526]|uniref:DUF6243 family protein n=1 Tax=Streptomyces sp. NPDC029526 TaxID=3155728 RepID=UPI0033FE650A
MSRGGGNMLGVGGTRRHLGRKALRGTGNGARIGGGLDPQAQKRELLRTLREQRQGQRSAPDRRNTVNGQSPPESSVEEPGAQQTEE